MAKIAPLYGRKNGHYSNGWSNDPLSDVTSWGENYFQASRGLHLHYRESAIVKFFKVQHYHIIMIVLSTKEKKYDYSIQT